MKYNKKMDHVQYTYKTVNASSYAVRDRGEIAIILEGLTEHPLKFVVVGIDDDNVMESLNSLQPVRMNVGVYEVIKEIK